MLPYLTVNANVFSHCFEPAKLLRNPGNPAIIFNSWQPVIYSILPTALDIMTTKLSRRKFLGMGAVLVGGSVAACTGFLYTQNESNQPVVERIKIPVKNLSPALAGFTLVLLSDFHLYPFTQLELHQKAVALATGLNPDLLLLGGDYVTRDAEAIFELASLFSGLNAKYGVFAIIGNHDYWSDVDVVKTGWAEASLPVLRNQGVALPVNGETLYLAGLDDAWNGTVDLQAAMSGWPEGAPTVLLAHEPDPADTYSQDERIALQLSGHSHGGQIRMPGLGAFILPHLGQKYDHGLYRVKDMWLYTNRGLGNVTEPVRVNCAPEVTEITLVQATA